MRSLPIFLAWVSTWRYRLNRAATPTVSRSLLTPLPWTVVCNTAQPFCQYRAAPCVGQLQAPRSGGSLCALEPTPERGLVHVVREDPLAVDLDDGNQLAVGGLELRVPVDGDLLELEPELLTKRPHLRQRPLTEVAVGRVVDRDLRHRFRCRLQDVRATP